MLPQPQGKADATDVKKTLIHNRQVQDFTVYKALYTSLLSSPKSRERHAIVTFLSQQRKQRFRQGD